MSRTDAHGISWELARHEGLVGTGNWRVFPQDRLESVWEAASSWKARLAGVDRPWLCWCIDDDWCFVQQQLVVSAGWTPVVGTDGSVAAPRLHEQAVFVDFNASLRLPLMWMHFPIEFVFAFCDKLAFWHSDVLPPVSMMKAIGRRFDTIGEGELIGVRRDRVSIRQRVRRLLKGRPIFYKRWFEVIGCTTAGASASQFENGCGWWRYPQHHPNAKPWIEKAFPREHGVGIWFWEKYCRGTARELDVDVNPYHYSTNQGGYVRRWKGEGTIAGSKRAELQRSFDFGRIVDSLGL